MDILLKKSIKLLHKYRDKYKDIDSFLNNEEISDIVKNLVEQGYIIRKPRHEDFGDYDKEEYEVELLNGENVICYPNAGKMVSLDKSGRVFYPSDVHSFNKLT